MSGKRQTLITIDGHIYEVTRFISSHPGEGIHDVYLNNYHTKDASEEFEKFHMTDEPFTWLENSVKNGFDSETGIYCVGPNYFKKRIPNYFKFFPEDKNGDQISKDLKPKTFVVLPNGSNLLIVVKEEDETVKRVNLIFKEKKWQTEGDSQFSTSNPSPNPEIVIESILTSKGYNPPS